MQHEEIEQLFLSGQPETVLAKKKLIKAMIDVCGPDLAEKVVAKDLMDWDGITDGYEEIHSILASIFAKQIVNECKAEKRD